jgi:hypothetical protein
VTHVSACIRVVPRSNLGRSIIYNNWNPSWLSSSLLTYASIIIPQLGDKTSFKILSVRQSSNFVFISVAYRGGFGGFTPSPPKFRNFDKAEPNSQFRGKYIRNLIIIWVSLICKLSGTPDQGATALRSPFSLPSVLNWICWNPQPPKKFLGTPLIYIYIYMARGLFYYTVRISDWVTSKIIRLYNNLIFEFS